MDRRARFGTGAVIALLPLSLAVWYIWPGRPDASSGQVDSIKIVQHRSDRQEVESMPSTKQVNVTASNPNPPAADQKTGAEIPDDPSTEASLFDPISDPRVLYRRIRSERRDKDWADRSERGIQNALAAIPNIGRGDALRINCAATLCEVRGNVPENASFENTDVAMKALQGDQFNRPLKTLDLEVYSASFGGGGKGMPFTYYIRRR